jgi:TM2 domain-containing membrane protein YozV
MTQSTVATASPKQVGLAYVLWFFFGVIGVHQFYLGKTGRGVLYIFTLGGFFGIGCLIDLFTLPSQVREVNTKNGFGAV